MLTIPKESDSTIIIAGIDPGSTNVGISLMTIDIESLNILNTIAWSFNASKFCGKDTWVEEIYNNRIVRIIAIEEHLLKVFNYYQPVVVSVEAPFINSRFPASGIALTETLSAIRSAVMKYDVWKSIYLVPPSSGKVSVGCKGNADKDAMKMAILNLPNINYTGDTPLELLDEHAIDAIAIGYSKYREIVSTYI